MKDSNKWFKRNLLAIPAKALSKSELENFQKSEGNSSTKKDECSKTNSNPKGRKSKAAVKIEKEIEVLNNIILLILKNKMEFF